MARVKDIQSRAYFKLGTHYRIYHIEQGFEQNSVRLLITRIDRT